MNQLREEILDKGITRLCHITKSSKLLHIMSSEEGIMATEFLENYRSDIINRNDHNRFDGHLKHISCSIEYPNTYYLNRIRNQDPLFKEWVIVFVNPLVILDKKTKFCHRNAASNYGSHIRSGLEGFRGMFENPVSGQRLIYRSPQMLKSCPTDAQAEVLIFGSIPRSEILAVAVQTFDQARIEIERLKFISGVPKLDFVVAPDLFNTNWINIVRSGQRPEELPYTEEG